MCWGKLHKVSEEKHLAPSKAEADAAKLRIATLKEDMETRAKGQKALNEAENVFTKEIVKERS